jgi:hypothetical protein
MNTTKNGRWGRYKIIEGEKHKMCNGPLHSAVGAWMPLRSFWTFKKGKRAGKPMSRCIACKRVYRGRLVNSGLVSVSKVYFIFHEIESRIGRAEACRRLGMSQNLWCRLDKRVYQHMEKQTVVRAMTLLQELRDKDIVRHRDSIRHGALARGHAEKEVKTWRDLYRPNGDDEAERGRRRRASLTG